MDLVRPCQERLKPQRLAFLLEHGLSWESKEMNTFRDGNLAILLSEQHEEFSQIPRRLCGGESSLSSYLSGFFLWLTQLSEAINQGLAVMPKLMLTFKTAHGTLAICFVVSHNLISSTKEIGKVFHYDSTMILAHNT